MKKNIHIVLICLLLASCKQAEVIYVDFDTFHPTNIEETAVITNDGGFNPVIRIPVDETVSDTMPAKQRIAATNINSIARNFLGCIKSNEVVQIAGTYTGHNIDGSRLTQSGKVILPKSGTIKQVVLVCHYTIGANYEAPSETFPFEGVLASKGYAVVLPDYIGFGVTFYRHHPYLHAESTARSVIDMGLAVLPYLEFIGRAPENKEIIVIGYSQGGAAALAVMRMIEKDYSLQLPLAKVYAGAGPYDLTGIFDAAIREDETNIPCSAPMLIQGLNDGDHLDLDIEHFFVPGLWKACEQWINQKALTVGQLNAAIGTKKVSEILSEYARTQYTPEIQRFYQSLARNSVLDFYPQAPLYMLHSKDDKTVPFFNSLRAQEHFNGCDVQYDFGHYGSHVNGFMRFVQTVSNQLE